MRKMICAVLALLLVFSLCACGDAKKDEKAEAGEVLTKYCEAVKAFDKDSIKAVLANGDVSRIEQKLSLLPEEFLETMKAWAGQMSYEIKDISVDDITAKASVIFKYSDAEEVMKIASKMYNEKASVMMGTDAINGYLNGPGYSQDRKDSETLGKEINEFLLQCLQSGLESAGTEEREDTVELDLVKYQGEWRIKNLSDDMFRILTSNVFALADDQ